MGHLVAPAPGTTKRDHIAQLIQKDLKQVGAATVKMILGQEA